MWDLGGTGEPPPLGWSGWASLGWDLRGSTDLGAGGQRPRDGKELGVLGKQGQKKEMQEEASGGRGHLGDEQQLEGE